MKAKPNAGEEKIEKIDPPLSLPLSGLQRGSDVHFVVAVKEPPRQGRANDAIAKALAKYFDTSISNVKLVSGFSSRQKVFEVKV